MIHLLTISFLFSLFSCAQLGTQSKPSELPYKVGDIVEVSFRLSNARNYEITAYRSDEVRNSNAGRVIITINGVDRELIQSFSKKIREELTAKVKMTHIDTDCERYQRSGSGFLGSLGQGKCSPNDSTFKDKANFISWGQTSETLILQHKKSHLEKIALDNQRLKQQQIEDEKYSKMSNPTIQRNKYSQKAKLCDINFNTVMKLRKSLGEPALTKKEIKSRYKKDEEAVNRVSACANSYLLTKKQTDDYLLALKCFQYSSTPLANDFCK